jgi:hypothetical protein
MTAAAPVEEVCEGLRAEATAELAARDGRKEAR